jgi:glycosyltransferase involved in cell wall biosynthesis
VKKSGLYVGWFLCLAVLAFGLSRGLHHLKSAKKRHGRTHTVAVTEEKPITVVIPSYNNSQWCVRNLQSVLEQKYSNFDVIYIDDHSSDDTAAKVLETIDRSPLKDKVTLIRNPERRGSLANLYRAIHTCPRDRIIIPVDGDDFMAHDGVLSKINALYANPSVWMSYGNFVDYPTFTQKPVKCKALPKHVVHTNTMRKHAWVSSHLRTFYAGLFHEIKLEDLLYKGRFLPMGGDLAFMFPMLEMAGSHCAYVKDVLYLYNRSNPLSDHKVDFALQNECSRHVRNLRPYARLKTPPYAPVHEQEKAADLVVFSYDSPSQLSALLDSIFLRVTHVNRVTVIYQASSEEDATNYDAVCARYPNVVFLKQSEDFQPMLMDAVFGSGSSYILFAVDSAVVKEAIDLKECIEALERSKAYGFYFTLGERVNEQGAPPSTPISDHLFAWRFSEGLGRWNCPSSIEMALYRKEEIRHVLQKIRFCHPNSLKSAWALKAKAKRIGLYYAAPKAVNVPQTQ